MNQLANTVLKFVFEHLVAQKWASGYRTYIGGTSLILAGVIPLLDMFVSGHYDETKMSVSIATIGLGYKVIGDRGQKDG